MGFFFTLRKWFVFSLIKTLFKKLHVSNFVEDFNNIVQTIYNKENKGKFHSNFNITTKDIINLCGGVPTKLITRCEMNITYISERSIKVLIFYKSKGKNIAKVVRIIDLKTMSIQNEEMTVFKRAYGISTNLFLNQIISARKFGFIQIDIHAAGGVDYNKDQPDKEFQGYCHWPKYGFLLDKESQTNFDKWAKENKRKEKTLWELTNKQDGYKLWRQKGISWNGSFYLSNKSISMKLLKKYLILKGINAPVNESAVYR